MKIPRFYIIISEFLCVVNYGSDGSISTILDKIKEFSSIQGDIESFSKSFKELYSSGKNIDDLIKKFPKLDKEIIDTAKAVSDDKKSLSDFDSACNKVSSSTAKFSATLKSVAANIGIMIAVTLAIKAVQYAWDKANTTVEEVKNKINELSDSISTLESEYNSLRDASSGGLTDAEQARLEYLEDRIAREKELLELEEARLIREKYGGGFTDYFDEGNYNAKYRDFREKYFNGMSDLDVIALGVGIDENNKAVTDLGSKVDEYNKISEEIQSYIDQMNRHTSNEQEYIWADELKTDAESKLENLIPILQEEYQNYKEAKYEAEIAIEEMTTDLDNPNLTDKDKAVIEAWIAEYQNVIKVADYYIGLMKGIPAVPLDTETDSYYNWFNKLSDEEKKFAESDEFKNALEEQKNSLDGAALSASNYDAALQKVKDLQLDVDESAISFSDVFSLKDADNTVTNLGKISESIDTIQNAYKTLNSAIDEYNETGAFSIDTLQSVIALGDDWLDYLVDEEGNLKLDKESLEQLTLSRLNDMRVQAINNVVDNVSKIETDAQANKYLESTNYALADSYEEVTQKALESARAKMEDAVASGNLSRANMNKAMQKAEADVAKINKLFSNVDLGSVSLSGGSGSGSKSSTKDYEELYDFFERRIKVLNDSISLLKANLENVNGSFAKNNLISAQSAIYQEELKNYTDAISMYQQKANEALATIPSDIAEKVKNGAVDLTTFMGESGEEVATAIKDYEKWADKVSECSSQLAELKETLRDLELEKFNNIIEDFTNQFDLRDKGINLITKQIDLLKEAGEMIGESFYVAQKDQATKQLALLQEEKIKLAEQLSSALSSGLIEKGTDEWYEMVTSLQEVEGLIIDCKKSIEEFDNAILDLNWQVFERIQDTFSNLNSELENLADLLDDIDVADDTTGNWTTDAITKLGLLAQQYELSQYKVAQYTQAIEELNKQYADGNYSTTEYADKLADLTQQQWEAINSSESIKDAIVDLNKTRIDEIIDGIEKEIEAYKELTNSQIEALEASQDLHEYEKSISEKTKSITDLEKQIAAMQNDNTAATIAKRKKLEEELAKAKQDLEETQYQHSIEQSKDALNKQYEDYEKTRNDEITALQDSLKNQEQIISESFEAVKQNASLIGEQITQIAQQHGVKVSNSLTSSWKQGENAIASYGQILSTESSAFIGNINSVENEVWALQYQANDTADSLAWMFATKSDNLVNELAESYYAEGNVLNMTNALQQSLVNTLERGYDVSGIVDAFNSIADAANKTRNALNNINYAPTPEGIIEVTKKDTSLGTYIKNNSVSKNQPSSNTTFNNTLSNTLAHELLMKRKYAKGVHNLLRDEIAWTQENGREIILSPSRNAVLTPLKSGDSVLTKVQTDNIFDWSKLKPVDILPNLNLMSKLPDIVNRGTSNPITIENKVIFTGAVNDANNFAKQIANIADQQITKSWKEFSNAVKY